MDYGRREYASSSSNQVDFMSEITTQYMDSIGRKENAGLKKPYIFKDYTSMMYLQQYPANTGGSEFMGENNFCQSTPFMSDDSFMSNDSFMFNFTPFAWTVPQAIPLRWLGGTFPMPPKPTPEPTPKPTPSILIFFLGFEGDYVDSVQGTLPTSANGNSIDSSVHFSGSSSLHEEPLVIEEDLACGTIIWEISGLNVLAFTVKFYIRGNNHVNYETTESVSLVGLFDGNDVGFAIRLLASQEMFIAAGDDKTVTVPWNDNCWIKCECIYYYRRETIKINGTTVISSAPMPLLVEPFTFYVGTSMHKDNPTSTNLWVDDVSISNN